MVAGLALGRVFEVAPSHMRAIFLYSLATGESVQITDGTGRRDLARHSMRAASISTSSRARTTALQVGWLDMSSHEHHVRRSVYLTVSSADEPRRSCRVSCDEPGRELEPHDSAPAKPAHAAARGKHAPAPRLDTATVTRVDLDGIQQRIIPLAIPPGDYGNLLPGSTGTFFFTETPFASQPGGEAYHLWQYRLADKRSRTFVDGIHCVRRFRRHEEAALRHAGQSLEHRRHGRAAEGGRGRAERGCSSRPSSIRAPSGRRSSARRGARSASSSTTRRCTATTGRRSTTKYLPLAASPSQHRADLGYLIATVGGELTVGHSYLEGEGDVPDTSHTVSVGLLGADFTVENGHYRIQHIYNGGNWNPHLQAPLSVPGIKVAEGDYILEVNGRPRQRDAESLQLLRGHRRTSRRRFA